MDDTKAQELFYGQGPKKRQRQNVTMWLMAPMGETPPDMSLADAVTCQSIQVFPATAEQQGVIMGQMGIRCCYCTNNPSATDFPSSVDTLASSVRMLADRHISSCSMAPSNVHDALARRTENEVPLIGYCRDFCRRTGLVDKLPPKTGIVFESSLTMEDSGISATPLARRSREPQQYDESYAFPQQPTPLGGQQPMYSGPAVSAGTEGGPSTATPGHATRPLEASMTPGSSDAMPHEGPPFGGMHLAQHPSLYEMQQQQQQPPPPTPYPFYQDHTGAWICRYCSSLHPQFRDPGSFWHSPHRTAPPAHFVDHHLSICRAYVQSMSQHPSMPQGWGGQPPHPYPPYRYPEQPQPYGGPPQQAWAGGPGMLPPQAATPGGPPHLPPDQGMYYPSEPVGGGIPPSDMMEPGIGLSPATPRAPPAAPSARTPSDSAMRAAIDHLVASDRKLTPVNEEDQLVLEEDKLLLTDYFYYLMKQLRLCRFSEADRKTRGGKRENIIVGYGGLQCVHCAEAPNSRKFFWSNVDRLANSFAEIPGHVLKCRRCPNQTKNALQELKLRHAEQMARLPRGSQKVFFRRMWHRVHDRDPKPEDETLIPVAAAAAATAVAVTTPTTQSMPSPEESKASTSSSSRLAVDTGIDGGSGSSPGTSGDDSSMVVQRATEDAAKALAASANLSTPPSPSSRILLALAEDKQWLSELDCFIRRNLEVFCATEDDVSVAQSDRKYPVSLGQVGIRCIHCALAKVGEGARGNAVAYPYSISGIYESVREFQRLHLESCPNLPKSVRTKLAGFTGSSSLSSVLRKHYIAAAKALGLYDTPDGIRSGGEPVPFDASAAAFVFSEARDVKEQRTSRESYMESGPMITPLESRKRKAAPKKESPEEKR